jgi:hypothetical protein
MGSSHSFTFNEIEEIRRILHETFGYQCCVEDWVAILSEHLQKKLASGELSRAERLQTEASLKSVTGKVEVVRVVVQDMVNTVIDRMLPIVHLNDVICDFNRRAELVFNPERKEAGDAPVTGGGRAESSSLTKAKSRLVDCRTDCPWAKEHTKEMEDMLDDTIVAFQSITRWTTNGDENLYFMRMTLDPTEKDPAVAANLERFLDEFDTINKEVNEAVKRLLDTLVTTKLKTKRCLNTVMCYRAEVKERFGATLYDIKEGRAK